jgi:DNA-binding LytR/AlgR family response regulator
MHTVPTALIAEDEPLLAAGLRAELARLWPGLEVVAQVGDGLSAVQQALALQPRICFLDIRMPACSGLEAAQALAEQWPEDDEGEAPAFPLLVFVTAYDDHAVEAFDAQAVDYLVKPVQPARLAACVARLQKRLSADGDAGNSAHADALQSAVDQLRGLLGGVASSGARAGTTATPRLSVIQAQLGSVVHLVPVREVVYFEAADKYLRVLTTEREYLIRTSLRELLPQLDPEQFWQIHRGTVVQAACIETALRDEAGKVTLTLRGRPDKLGVSRIYAHLFKGM